MSRWPASGKDLLAILRIIRDFLFLVIRRFVEDQSISVAGYLSYVTLLSLVPLLAVVFSVISAFPVFENVIDRMQEYIFQNFVPATGEAVHDHFQEFLDQAARLTGFGITFLVIIALMLMNSIDETINRIWRISRQRQMIPKLAVYWAVLTLGPMLVAVSIALTSYLVSLPQLGGVTDGFGARLLALTPFVFTTLALALLYIIVPYSRVPLFYGLTGAVFAALLFELAKQGFAIYVANVPTYATIYGALAVVPLFLVWIYISWLIVLLGAEFVYCMTIFRTRHYRPVEDRAMSDMIVAFRLLGHFWRMQARGESLSKSELLSLEPAIRPEVLDKILQRMEQGRLIHFTEDGKWGLGRDLDDYSLLDLYRDFPAPLFDVEGSWKTDDDWNRTLHERLAKAKASVDVAMQVSLKRLYQEGEKTQEVKGE